mgnify:CR=1 FL=1
MSLPPVEKRKTLEDLIAEDARSPIPTLHQPNTISGSLPPTPQNFTGLQDNLLTVYFELSGIGQTYMGIIRVLLGLGKSKG